MSIENKEVIEYSRSGKVITALDNALDRIVHGVAIITTAFNNRPYGMAAAWFTRASNEPYLVAVSVWKKNFTHQKIQESRIFAINILEEGKKDLAVHFGQQSGRDVNKFKQIGYRTGKSDSPILCRDIVAYVDCQVVNTLDAEDHTIFLGKVIQAEIVSPNDPLIFNRKDFPYHSNSCGNPEGEKEIAIQSPSSTLR